MKNIFNQVGHVAVQVLLVAIPFILSAGFSWEKLTVGGILSAIYAYLIKKSAVAGVVASAKVQNPSFSYRA